ncbi:MAG: thiol:disulfide interchange protein DsbA/DsbL [Rhodanobacteraceae bacterium]|jgi:thiol:disulfide interchange protein DsbA|nr:thiol:disulfide interchange protein DsbA/DsbL [Rhodanobacteraceae bacterium]
MFKRATAVLFGLAVTAFAQAADTFQVGKHYFMVEPPQPTSTGSKVEVLEVFSYACPACNLFEPTMRKLKAALPANAEMAYLPAGFRPDEDWPVFQRAFFAAQTLGILDKTHEATFDAIWKDDGPLRISDPVTNRPKKPMPSVEDVAQFYSKFGVKAEDVVGVANSFAVNTKVKRADAQLKAYGVDSTPTIIVNGKYRLTGQSAGSIDQIIPLVQFLVAKESTAK